MTTSVLEKEKIQHTQEIKERFLIRRYLFVLFRLIKKRSFNLVCVLDQIGVDGLCCDSRHYPSSWLMQITINNTTAITVIQTRMIIDFSLLLSINHFLLWNVILEVIFDFLGETGVFYKI